MFPSEKLMKYDVKRREYDVVVIGEEPHLAYNRVGLTSFFQHRQVENLYLNPKEWVGTSSSEDEVYAINLILVCINAGRLAELPSQHPRYRNRFHREERQDLIRRNGTLRYLGPGNRVRRAPPTTYTRP